MTRVWLVLLGFLVFCILLSCGRNQPTHSETMPQTPAELARDIRDGKDHTGKRLTLNLVPKSYTCAPGVGLLWHNTIPSNQPPTLVLLCIPPPNNTRALRLTCTVRSCDWDDIDRGGGIRFTVTLDVAEIITR